MVANPIDDGLVVLGQVEIMNYENGVFTGLVPRTPGPAYVTLDNARAMIAKEQARFDWLLKNHRLMALHAGEWVAVHGQTVCHHQDPRVAIDAVLALSEHDKANGS